MSERSDGAKNNLNVHWLIVIAMSLTVLAYVAACHYFGPKMQIGIESSQRVLIRTILYVIAIMIFPFTSLLRHILLRLNQTMPGDNPARNRYLVTVIGEVPAASLKTLAEAVEYRRP